jgi:hypothetical protein
MAYGIVNRSGHMILYVLRNTRGMGGRRDKQPPEPIKWLHSDAEGCLGVMVEKSIMAVKLKQDGDR